MDVALVVGGTSFVGRHVGRLLAVRGVSYVATSRVAKQTFLQCDLRHPGELSAVVQAVRPRWIFACAGATSQSSALELHALHVAATEELLEAAALHAPDAVTVLLGSAAEYGAVTAELLPIGEDTPAHPQSDYGKSKLAQLHAAQRLARDRGLRVHVVRPFNLLGPGLPTHYFPASLCGRLRQAKQAGHQGPITVVNGQATRDWVDVRDAADAIVRLAVDALPEAGSVRLYNIATGIETPVLALAEHLCRLAGVFRAVDEGTNASRSGIDRSCGDASRLRAATGWQPRIPWQRSAEELWQSVWNSGD
jgi:nucleoside-diphosphate-sugar epimerase